MRAWIIYLVASLFWLLVSALDFLLFNALISGFIWLAFAVTFAALAWHHRLESLGTLPARDDLPTVLGLPVRWEVVVAWVTLAIAMGLFVFELVHDYTAH